MSNKYELFSDMENVKVKSHKWLFFPMSLLFHGILIAAVVVVPLMNAQSEYPQLKTTNMLMVAPPPPAPGVPTGKKSSGKAVKKRKPKKEKPKPKAPVTFTAPIEIPDEIQEEELDDSILDDMGGNNSGVIGVPYDETGDSNWDELLRKDNSAVSSTTQVTVISPPRLIRRVAPQYSVVARKANIQGIVIIQAVTDIYGRVDKVTVLSGHPLLRNSAIQAIKQWIYEPYIINGVPKPVKFNVSVNFTLKR